jgi:hypothetical protein
MGSYIGKIQAANQLVAEVENMTHYDLRKRFRIGESIIQAFLFFAARYQYLPH